MQNVVLCESVITQRSEDAGNCQKNKVIKKSLKLKSNDVLYKEIKPIESLETQLTHEDRKRKIENNSNYQISKVVRSSFLISDSSTSDLSPLQTAENSALTNSPSTSFVVLDPTVIKQEIQDVIERKTESIFVSSSDKPSLSVDFAFLDPENFYARHELRLSDSETKFHLGIPKDVYFVTKLASQYSQVKYADVMLTIKKLRTNYTYRSLANDFCVKISDVENIFLTTLPKLANVLKQLIFWPDSVDILQKLPMCFRKKYSYIQSLIDCFEIEIQKPTNPIHQALTWSKYKQCNTLKILISSTPDGHVNYISSAFGGRISDAQIVEVSGYLDVLPSSTWIMAGRGFKQISKLFLCRKCILIRAPSTFVDKKNSRAENSNLIEKVIERIRKFKMLGPHVPIEHKFVPYVDYFIIIATAIVNLQGSMIR